MSEGIIYYAFVCVSQSIITKGLLGKGTVHWGTWEFHERSGVFMFYVVLEDRVETKGNAEAVDGAMDQWELWL